MEAVVRDGNLDEALRILKRKVYQDGIFSELKDRSEPKPSIRRRDKRRKAMRRRKKNEARVRRGDE